MSRFAHESLTLPLPNPIPRGEPAVSSVMALVGWNPGTEREEILLTKRTENVATHKGQVSFPGGFWQKSDEDLLMTALRETHEEIGILKDAIKVMGALAPVRTRGNILVYPWVGHLNFPYPFQVNPAEVASLLYLPVQTLLETGLKPVSVNLGNGVQVESKGIWVNNELVWGATARMLEELREKILASFR